MYEIEIPQQYAEALLLRCAELGISPEEYMKLLIINYLERNHDNG